MLCSATKVAAASCQPLLPGFNQAGAATHVPAGAAGAAAAGAAAGAAVVAAGGVAGADWFWALAQIQGNTFKATTRTIPTKARARFIPFSPSSDRRLVSAVSNSGTRAWIGV